MKAPILKIQNQDSKHQLILGFPIHVNGEDQWAFPKPPLNFSIQSDGKRPSFKPQIEKLVINKGTRDITVYLQAQANLRNRLLYAGPEGYPKIVNISPDFFDTRRVRVLALVRAYLLIQPYAELLPFVQDALDAFLAMIGRLREHDLHIDL
jgi:hypothetical protein